MKSRIETSVFGPADRRGRDERTRGALTGALDVDSVGDLIELVML